MKKKIVSVLLCAAMVVTMAAGCGSKGGDGSKKGDSAKKVVYWSMWEATEPQGQAIQEAVDAYTKETGVKVDLQFKGREGNRQALQPALDSGTQIDLFDEDIDRVNGAYGKYLMDLEELAKDAGYEETANAGLMSACREAGGGTLKSIPYQPNVFAFFYNQDLFDKAGAKVPTTWDEFLATCQALKDAGITPMTMDDAYATSVIGYHLGRYIGENGVREVVKEGLWDDPAVVQMAKDIEELASKGYFSENVGTNVWPNGQTVELATNKEVAMYLNGSWLPNEVKDAAGDDMKWGCFAYPALKECQTNVTAKDEDGNELEVGPTGTETNNFGAQVFGINKDSKVGKETFDLIKFITKGEYDKKLADASTGIPADTTNTEWPELVSCAKPVIEQSTTRFTWAVGVESNENMTPVIKENFIKLMAGTINADEFVKAMMAASK